MQARDAELHVEGCTQAELCGLGPDKYVHRVHDLCTLVLLCKVETTSDALLQA